MTDLADAMRECDSELLAWLQQSALSLRGRWPDPPMRYNVRGWAAFHNAVLCAATDEIRIRQAAESELVEVLTYGLRAPRDG